MDSIFDRIQHWFTYHPPTGPEQIDAYKRVRDAGMAFGLIIAENTPSSADQSAALRKVREAVMTANAAIACGGK